MRKGRVNSNMRKIQSELETSSPALYQELLPREVIEEAVVALQFKFRRRVYTPIATLWMWVGQVFDSDGSCRGAVAKAFSWLFANKKEKRSTDCSPYCRARGRLSEDLVERVTQKISEELDHP